MSEQKVTNPVEARSGAESEAPAAGTPQSEKAIVDDAQAAAGERAEASPADAAPATSTTGGGTDDVAPETDANATSLPEAESGTSSSDADEVADVGGDATKLREKTVVKRPAFQPIDAHVEPGAHDNIDLLMDVSVMLTIELGGAEMPLREILNMGKGSVVKLDRAIGDPVDILINRELVGRGEVVVVDDQFGIRVTELVKTKPGGES